MNSKSIKVLLVEDEKALRQMTSWFLQDQKGIEVVGEAENENEAVTMAGKFLPDIVLMDVSLGSLFDMKGVKATSEIKALHPEMKVIGFSIHEKPNYVQEMVNAGASGYFGKYTDDMESIVSIIKTVQTKNHYFSKNIALALKNSSEEKSPSECLTSIEIEILQLIAQGKPMKEIAGLRNVTISTVDTQRRSILQKLNLHTDVDLVLYSLRQGLVDL